GTHEARGRAHRRYGGRPLYPGGGATGAERAPRERALELRGEPGRGTPERAAGTAYLPHDRRGRSHRSPLREPYGADGSRGDASLAPAFEPRRQPRREPARAERVGSARDGLGVFRAIRYRAGTIGPAGRRLHGAVR